MCSEPSAGAIAPLCRWAWYARVLKVFISLRTSFLSLCVLLLVFTSPTLGQEETPDGGFAVGDRWVSFSLPAIFPRYGSPSRGYRADRDVLKLQVYPLQMPADLEVTRTGAKLDDETEHFLAGLLRRSQLEGTEYKLGELTSHHEAWDERSVVRVENVLPARVEQIVFTTLDGEAYAFVFRPEREMDLKKIMKTVVTSSRHSETKPSFSRANRAGGREVSWTIELALIWSFGWLIVLLVPLSTATKASEKAYDVCRARRRLSVRESFRIFWSTFWVLVVVSLAYLAMVHGQWSLTDGFLKSEDLSVSLLGPGLLLVVMCSAFTLIGARLGFHRSKQVSQLGAIVGMGVGLFTAYQALSYVLLR